MKTNSRSHVAESSLIGATLTNNNTSQTQWISHIAICMLLHDNFNRSHRFLVLIALSRNCSFCSSSCETAHFTSVLLQMFYKFFRSHSCLSENTAQCTTSQFFMQRNNTT